MAPCEERQRVGNALPGAPPPLEDRASSAALFRVQVQAVVESSPPRVRLILVGVVTAPEATMHDLLASIEARVVEENVSGDLFTALQLRALRGLIAQLLHLPLQ